MKTYILVKDTGTIPQAVAHLYEHWFIASFYRYAQQHSRQNSGLTGYIGGETFDSMQFIEAWFYDNSAAQLFETFMATEPLATDLLQTCINQCTAEDREQWTITDQAALTKQLDELKKLAWQAGQDLLPQTYSEHTNKRPLPFTIKKTAHGYRTVKISALVPYPSVEDKALFLRLYILVNDIIGHYIQLQGWYQLGAPDLYENDDCIFLNLTLSLPKSKLTTRQLAKDIEQYLRQFDVATNLPYINAHFAEFAQQPLWSGRMRDDLHYVDVIAGNPAITKLATELNLASIFSRLRVTANITSFKK